jgi:mono/diheme cytochrome c family protein
VLLLAAGGAFAQNAAVERGISLYRMHCATPYCHGPDGGPGRAPKVAGHSHTLNSMFKIISWGVPGTGMPEFTTKLKTEEINDLVAYMMTLRGTASPAAAPAPVAPALTPEARAGRALFFDAARSGACGNCHEIDGWGVPVGPDPTAPGGKQTGRVRTARPAGEAPFPSVLVEHTETRVRLYDLSSPIPVLRTFAPGQVSLGPETSWRHEQVTKVYTPHELEIIGRYLRWRGER